MENRLKKLMYILLIAGLFLLSGCGGGGSDSSIVNAAQEAEKKWVRKYLDDVYLWYDEIIEVSPANYASVPAYYDALLVKTRDRFSFSMPVAAAAIEFQEGLETGFGIKWGWSISGTLFAYYVDPHSPASASITRGTELTNIDGYPVASLSSSYLSNKLFPIQPNETLNVTFRLPGAATATAATLISATFTTTTVDEPLIIPLDDGSKAGYLLFNQHLATSEQNLIDAIAYFKQQEISDVVLDLRYNSGGFLYIAEEVASMLGGEALQGKVFEKLVFNSKHQEKTNDPSSTIIFSASDSNNTLLPLLGLKRVFVLTGGRTCSASESIINGLLPYIQVVRIGSTTCGKPYGFIQENNEQQAYFAIQFEGINANGTDNYKYGFAPTCSASDDLAYQLGDVREARLKAALYYIHNNSCPPTSVAKTPQPTLSDDMSDNGFLPLMDRKQGLKLLLPTSH